jgi:hypothetical protein
MSIEEYEKRLFNVINEAIEDRNLPLAQIYGITAAAAKTVESVLAYRVFETVKQLGKQHQPD